MTLAANLAHIILGLCRVLDARCATDITLQPLGLLIWARLLEAATDFQFLCVRWRAGRLRASRPRPQAERARAESEATAGPTTSLPRGFAWLMKLVPEAAVYGLQLQHLLTDPQWATLLAEAPQAGRILRPICRMLGVQPLPQMLPQRAPKPHTPATETALREPPPREPPTATMAPKMTAKEKQRWVAENITLGRRRSPSKDPEDLRRLRPFTMWWRHI